MKINDANVAGLASPGVGKAQEAEQGARLRQGRREEGASSSTDHVQLSGLSEALRGTQSESPERAAHVERLSQEVQSGRYHVDSVEISKSIIEHASTPDANREE